MATDTKQLLKILIGTAWLDGEIQPEEQQYLQRIAQEKGLLEDLELHPWLHGLRSVSAQECYGWVSEYLGQHPNPKDCQELLEEISGLIYSDGDVDNEEALFLTQIQHMDAQETTATPPHETLTHRVQQLYRRWVSQ